MLPQFCSEVKEGPPAVCFDVAARVMQAILYAESPHTCGQFNALRTCIEGMYERLALVSFVLSARQWWHSGVAPVLLQRCRACSSAQIRHCTSAWHCCSNNASCLALPLYILMGFVDLDIAHSLLGTTAFSMQPKVGRLSYVQD